jgi:CubicO group peptidase (beta-lactamase class C family)
MTTCAKRKINQIKHSMRIILFFLLYLSFHNLSAQVLNKQLDSLFLKEEFNGAVLIVQNDTVIGKTQRGVADEIGTKLTSTSAFNLASVSKHFTGLAVAKLLDEGRIKYEAPIWEYLPQLKHSKYKSIKLYHLIHHTSGLPEYDVLFKNYPRYAKPFATNKTLLDLFRQQKPDLVFRPGDKFEYSNTGYIFLASIVEAISGTNFGSFLDKKFFKPLEMDNAFGFSYEYQSLHPERVKGLRLLQQASLHDLTPLDGVIGDGNIYLSLDDLVKWDRYLNSQELLSAEWKAKYFSPGKNLPAEALPYGFGWVVFKDRQVIQHAGEWVGFNTFYYKDLKAKSTMVILSNGSIKAEDFNKMISQAIIIMNSFQKPIKE